MSRDIGELLGGARRGTRSPPAACVPADSAVPVTHRDRVVGSEICKTFGDLIPSFPRFLIPASHPQPGTLLDSILEAIDVPRSSVYITWSACALWWLTTVVTRCRTTRFDNRRNAADPSCVVSRKRKPPTRATSTGTAVRTRWAVPRNQRRTRSQRAGATSVVAALLYSRRDA